MSIVALNLSRKWRSQNFDQIVGQELAVRILKNSLYLGHYFPVYLCAGQRGCGKTSMARIFAAAVNCHALPSFQKNPKSSSVPCLICASCIAMREGNHPDFIEIDAASHTGVDNIRNIIESSSLLPTMGRKRVYLIDEAHMLSKAAFNAALKILEEPPASALFILATTNPQKIIDTVRSRCFQLFFTPVAHEPLKNHLEFICKQEKIAYTNNALDLIARYTEGSVRDALNLLEQVRFSHAVVNENAVLALLGHVDDQHIINIIQLTMQGASKALVQLLHSLHIDNHKAEAIWQRMVILLRAMLWIKYDVQPHEIGVSIKLVEAYAQRSTLSDIHCMIEALYAQEELFLKTALQHIFLEMILVDLCHKNIKKNGNGDGSAPCTLGVVVHDGERVDVENDEEDDDGDDEDAVINYDKQWQRFVESIESLNDPLVCSVFKQARFVSYESNTHHVSIELSKDFILFKESLEKSRTVWQPLLREHFSSHATIDIQFTGIQKVELHSKKQKSDEMVISPQPSPVIQQQKEKQFYAGSRYNTQKAHFVASTYKNEVRIDVSDANKWTKSAMLLRHFPGVITEIREKQ